MTLEGRIHRLEASLPAKEKFFLWLHRAKAAGGIVPYWEMELKGPMVPFDWLEDEEAFLLFHFVNDLNSTILRNASKNQDLRIFAHCALDGTLRRICRLDESGVFVPVHPIPELATRVGKYVCAKFKSLLEETELMASAIDVISETYLGDEDILFSDIRDILDGEVTNLRTTADVYAPLTYWLKIEPLTLKGLAPDSPIVHAKVDSIIQLSRAEALVGCSDLRKFKDALQRAFPEFT